MAEAVVPPGVAVESDGLTSSPLLLRQPYLILFPLGVLLSWAGVAHWFLHAAGVLADYRPVFHVMVQIQGFMTCLAVGFLFTMVPRRTGSAPPAAWQLSLAVIAPLATTAAAWLGLWRLSQIVWLGLMAVVVVFLVRRFVAASSRRRPPVPFVWIPMALLLGMGGSLLTLWFPAGQASWAVAHQVGRGLLLQGMFTGLFLGVGSLALPLMTRGEAPPDGVGSARDRTALAAHVVAGVVLATSFWIEVSFSLRVGLLVRSLVVLAILTLSIRLWRPPLRPGWNARLIWLSAWMFPVGYLLAALVPGRQLAGLHVTFVAGFALLGLAVSAQVTLGHGGHGETIRGRPWQVLLFGLLMMLAAGLRFIMEIDRRRYFLWMMLASAAFLVATLVWGHLVLPRMTPSDTEPEHP